MSVLTPVHLFSSFESKLLSSATLQKQGDKQISSGMDWLVAKDASLIAFCVSYSHHLPVLYSAREFSDTWH